MDEVYLKNEIDVIKHQLTLMGFFQIQKVSNFFFSWKQEMYWVLFIIKKSKNK